MTLTHSSAKLPWRGSNGSNDSIRRMQAGATRMVAILLAFLCVAVSAACGTSDGLDHAQANIDLSDVHVDRELSAMLPESIKKDGFLTVGTNASWAPAEFTGEDAETIIGYDIDLAKAIAKVLGLEMKPVNASFSTLIPSVGRKFDIAISGFTITAERQKSVTFVQSFEAGMSYAVKASNPKNIDIYHLCGQRVSVQIGTAEETALEADSQKCVANGEPAIAVQAYPMQTQATTAVIAGRADVMYADSPVSAYAVKQTEDRLQLLGEAQEVAPQGIVIQKDDEATAQAVSKALQKLIDSGVYKRILDAWGVGDGAIDKAEINPQV